MKTLGSLFFFNVYLFNFEGERQSEREQRRGREREGERESQAGSAPSAQSPIWGSNSQTVSS